MSESPDARRVPAGVGRSEVREKASRFFAIATGVSSPEAAEDFLGGLRREYHDATHVAFAWKIGAGDAAISRSSDAGEPSGTAGRPIALAIDASGLTDVAVAVVRYFGGTKLGTGGLARAYRLAAERALAACPARTLYAVARLEVRCSHARAGAVRRLLRPPEVRLSAERFEPEPVFELEVRRSLLEEVVKKLDELKVGSVLIC